MEFFDFIGIGAERLAGLGPDDDRRHAKARARREIVQATQHIGGRQLEADLFMGFAECGFDDRFLIVEAAARKSELARMMAQLGCSSCDQEAGFAILVGGHNESDGGRTEFGIRLSAPFKSVEIIADSNPKVCIEIMSVGCHGGGA